MIKNLLLWFLKDEIICIAEHEAQKTVGVLFSPRMTDDGQGFTSRIDKVYLQRGKKRIFINDFTVLGEEQYSLRNLSGVVLSASNDDPVPAKPLVSVDLEQPLDADKRRELPFYYHDVLRLLNEGLSDREIYNKVYMSITDIQYQNALGWAKENRGTVVPEATPMASAPVAQDDEKLIGTAGKSIRGKRAPKYDVEAIKNDLREGMTAKEVADYHEVSLPTVYKIKREINA